MSPARRETARSHFPISTGSRATPQRDTNIEADELITAVELPAQGFRAHYSYLKIRDRLSYAFALVSVAAALELEGDSIKEARIAFGGVAQSHGGIAGQKTFCAGRANPAKFARAAQVLLRDAKGFAHNSFKIDLAARASPRAHPGGAGNAAVAVQQDN